MSKLFWVRRPRSRHALPAPARPTLEALEDRCLLSVGAPDATFNGTGKRVLTFLSASDVSQANAVAVQPDGKIVAAGFVQRNGAANASQFAVARFNADGTLDGTFANVGEVVIDFGFAGGNGQATGVALQADGKVVVSGFGAVVSAGQNDFALARLNADGSLDTTFNGSGKVTIDFGFDDQATAVALRPSDGKIVVAGFGNQSAVSAVFLAARLNANGTLDPSFNGTGKQTVSFGVFDRAYAVAAPASGKIVLAGSAQLTAGANPTSAFAVARLNADGSLDASFNGTGKQTVSFDFNNQASAVAVQPDGRVVVAGTTGAVLGSAPNDFAVARFLDNGTLDPAFGIGGKQTINLFDLGNPTSGLGGARFSPLGGMALQGDGKIVLGGYSYEGAVNNNDFVVARLNPDGSLDPAFGGNGLRTQQPYGFEHIGHETVDFNGADDRGYAVALDPLGRIVEVGSSKAGAGNAQFAVARLIGVDSFGPGMFDPASATWYLRNRATAGAPDAGQFAYGGPGWIPVVGDWDGDGLATIGVVNPTSMTWYLKNSNTPGAPDIAPFAYGAPGDIPVVGDWDGDRTFTVGVYRPSNATWYLRNSNSPGAPDLTPVAYGAPGDVPVVGDWDADGTPTLGVYRPSNATWYLRNSNSPGAPDVTPFAYGASFDKPVVGDWDGDGTWTVGVFDSRGNGGWLLRNSNTPGAPDVTPFAYGAPVWAPVAGHFGFPSLPLTLLAEGGEGPGAAAISRGDLNAGLTAALGRLQQAGVSPDLLSRLSAANAYLKPLPPGELGEALPAQNAIELSPDGAGHGWFVDPTPYQDEEFAAGTAFAGSPAAGREDLLTAVLHELGHLAGLADDSGSALMRDALPTGTRRTDALSTAFANLGS